MKVMVVVVVLVMVEMVEKEVILGLFGEEEGEVDGGLELVFGELLESKRGRRWWPRVAGQGLAKGCCCCHWFYEEEEKMK